MAQLCHPPAPWGHPGATNMGPPRGLPLPVEHHDPELVRTCQVPVGGAGLFSLWAFASALKLRPRPPRHWSPTSSGARLSGGGRRLVCKRGHRTFSATPPWSLRRALLKARGHVPNSARAARARTDLTLGISCLTDDSEGPRARGIHRTLTPREGKGRLSLPNDEDAILMSVNRSLPEGFHRTEHR